MKIRSDSRWMERFGKRWLPLENASKIFLATFDEVDTKVYRFTVALKEEVDPVQLQKAVDFAFDQMDLYRASIRRGVFWYYFQESTLRPVVKKETDVPCASIYSFDYQGLLFRVLYNHNRIHLEVFHALSDGSGAIAFLRLILHRYFGSHAQSLMSFAVKEEHMLDSFRSSVKKEKRPSLLTLATHVFGRARKKKVPIFHLPGTLNVDERMRVIELQYDTKTLLSLAKSYSVTITVFLTALFMHSMYKVHQEIMTKKHTVSIAVSVDLRKMFPSNTARNFFATVVVDYSFKDGTALLEEICQRVKDQFEEKITQEKLENKLRQLMKLEESLALRFFPRPLKDQILKIANFINNRSITAAMTNTGNLGVSAFQQRIHSAGIMTAAVRPQFSMMSHNDVFTITFTSPFQEDCVQGAFIGTLKELGVEGTIYGNRVFGDESKHTVKVDTSVYPEVPLRMDSHKMVRWLTVISIVISLFAILYRAFVPDTRLSLRFVAILLVGLWAVVVSLIRKRRNPNKAVLYQVGIFAGLTILWDFLSGWTGWSINYALPLVITVSMIAGVVVATFSRLRSGDKVLYLQGTAVLGFISFVLLLLNIVTPKWPSIVVVIFSIVVLAYTMIRFYDEIKREIRKRFHF